jgi:hypothetical protein
MKLHGNVFNVQVLAIIVLIQQNAWIVLIIHISYSNRILHVSKHVLQCIMQIPLIKHAKNVYFHVKHAIIKPTVLVVLRTFS